MEKTTADRLEQIKAARLEAQSRQQKAADAERAKKDEVRRHAEAMMTLWMKNVWPMVQRAAEEIEAGLDENGFSLTPKLISEGLPGKAVVQATIDGKGSHHSLMLSVSETGVLEYGISRAGPSQSIDLAKCDAALLERMVADYVEMVMVPKDLAPL